MNGGASPAGWSTSCRALTVEVLRRLDGARRVERLLSRCCAGWMEHVV